jgi:hypothetical protein
MRRSIYRGGHRFVGAGGGFIEAMGMLVEKTGCPPVQFAALEDAGSLL